MMKVPLVDGTAIYNVDVHEYRNAKDYYQGTDDISSDHDVTHGMGAFHRLKNAIIKHSQKLGSLKYRCSFAVGTNGQVGPPYVEEVHLHDLELCFAGKGSPEQIQQVLRLAQGFGLIGREDALMTRYVEKNLGIDCSGFVSNYLRNVGGLDIHPDKVNSVKYRSLGTPVPSLAAVKGCDVIAFATTNHVAIIDSSPIAYDRDSALAVQSVYCYVVESTGADAVSGDKHTDGLMGTYYYILPPDKHGHFSVARSHGWEMAHGKWDDHENHQKQTFKVHLRRLL
jgi:hypothetical protein